MEKVIKLAHCRIGSFGHAQTLIVRIKCSDRETARCAAADVALERPATRSRLKPTRGRRCPFLEFLTAIEYILIVNNFAESGIVFA